MSDKATEPEAAAAKPAKPAKEPKAAKAAPAEKKAKKGFNWVFLLVPIALIAAGVLAFSLPPTHAMLANGPLKPLLARFSHEPAGKPGAKPVDPAADNKRLAGDLESAKKSAAAKDAQIAQLQSHVNELQAPAAAPSAPASKPTPVAVSEDVKRTATYWAAMDADKAAEIVKQLPNDYVKGVFSQMPADAVSDIMSELPAKTAARLTLDADPAKP